MISGTAIFVLAAVLAVLLLLTTLAVWLWAIAPAGRKPDFTEFKNYDYAHRGLHNLENKVPENSLTAFSLAALGGFGMEFDLQLTKDKQVVVHHDHTIKRTCGVDKLISDMTLEELRGYRLFGTEEKVPLFSEVLKTVDGKTPLIIELKGYNNPDELCYLVMDQLKDYTGWYCVESFDPRIVRWFKDNRPDVVRGQLMDKMKAGENGLSATGAFFARKMMTNWYNRPNFEAYNFKYRSFLSLKVARRFLGMQEVSWTLRTEEDYKKARALGNLCIFENFLPASIEEPGKKRSYEQLLADAKSAAVCSATVQTKAE